MGYRARAVAFLVAAGLLLMLPSSAVAAANLSVDHTAETADPVVQGSSFQYDIELRNNGPDTASNVTLRDYVPPGTSPVFFIQIGGPAFSVSFSGTEFVASIASLAPGTVATFKVSYTAVAAATISDKVQAVASTPDPDLSNNEDVETTTVLTRGLSLTISDAKDPVEPGQNIEYTLIVMNRGASAATGVVVEDTLPAQTKFVSVSGPAGWTLTTPPVGGTGKISATNASVAAGSTHTFTLVVNAPSAGVMENFGGVGGTVADGDALNNYDLELTTVAEPTLPSPQLPTPPTNPTTPTPAASCKGVAATIVGTDDADTLTGTPGADVIAALAGKDVVKALGGGDVVCGGDGGDDLRGGGGKDELRGEGGKDRLSGGGSADRLAGGKGRDTCTGGAGKDTGGCETRKSF